jgi:hypothetical protein
MIVASIVATCTRSTPSVNASPRQTVSVRPPRTTWPSATRLSPLAGASRFTLNSAGYHLHLGGHQRQRGVAARTVERRDDDAPRAGSRAAATSAAQSPARSQRGRRRRHQAPRRSWPSLLDGRSWRGHARRRQRPAPQTTNSSPRIIRGRRPAGRAVGHCPSLGSALSIRATAGVAAARSWETLEVACAPPNGKARALAGT